MPHREPTRSDSELAALLEDAFPRDWERGDSADAAQRLRASLATRNTARRRHIAHELDGLLDRGLCDMQLADVVAFELGCHLRPAQLGMTPSEWLLWIGREVDSG